MKNGENPLILSLLLLFIIGPAEEIFWGLAYRFFPERLGAIIISHALWDCAVFIWFPIM